MIIIDWIRNTFTPLEWTILAIVAFLMLVTACSMYDAILACGSQGVGPAAPETC